MSSLLPSTSSSSTSHLVGLYSNFAQCEQSSPAVVLSAPEEDSEKEESNNLEEQSVGLRTDLEALIGDKKQKNETKKRFHLIGTKKDKNKDIVVEPVSKDPLLFQLLPRINCSFDKGDIEEGEQESSRYPYSSSVYYDALEEPVVVGEGGNTLEVHHPLSQHHQQGLVHQQQQQQLKTNSPASLFQGSAATCVVGQPAVLNYTPTSSPHKPPIPTAASMVRRLTGSGSAGSRKRHQQQNVIAVNESASSSSSGGVHLATTARGSRHQPVQARHNQMYLITTLLPNGQSTDQQALINRLLPKELILRVFSYLDIVSLCRGAQVCRSWNKLAMDGSNWQSVDLFHFQKDVKTAVVESLARRCGGFLKTLSLKGCENVQDSAMRSFAAKCPNIERLSLNKCKLITDATCEFIGRYCHRLKELDLENCTAITDLTMKFISEGCKRLEELNISWCENITDRGIAYICRGSPNLRILICKGCEGLSPSCFAQVNNDLKQLRKLSLLSCSNVTDETVEQLANGCNQLEFLCLSNCKEITDQALNAIAQGCPNIKDLELASCTNLTDTGFITLSKNCHELERMDLEDCSLITDAALLNLNNGCPNLSSLALSHCENLTDTGLAELCATHKDCLAVLELDNCPNITDAALDSMKTLKQLERVDLFDCQMITKDAIKKFKQFRPEVDVHAYFAPATPPAAPQPQRNGICRCCAIL